MPKQGPIDGPQADRGPLADAVQAVAQADAGGGLAFAGGRGRDRRDQHQLTGRRLLHPLVETQRDLGLVLAVVLQVLLVDAELGGDLLDPLDLGLAGNLDVGQTGGLIGHGGFVPGKGVLAGKVGPKSLDPIKKKQVTGTLIDANQR
jgi:hypothetical protein